MTNESRLRQFWISYHVDEMKVFPFVIRLVVPTRFVFQFFNPLYYASLKVLGTYAVIYPNYSEASFKEKFREFYKLQNKMWI